MTTLKDDEKCIDELVDSFAPGARAALTGGAEVGPNSFVPKIFAKPFRLVFNKTETQEITWIEVRSLGGLKTVTDRVASGKLTPINSWSTLDRQLWGFLAEHVGFLRFAGPEGALNEGIQPIGAEQAQLADDMSELFGGFEPAIKALSEMRARVCSELGDTPEPFNRDTHYLKDDGVNLTPEGEDILAEMVYGDQVKGESLIIRKTAANAEVLLDSTPAQNPTDYAIEEIEADNKELQTTTGIDAEIEARKVEEAAEGLPPEEPEKN